MPVQRLPEVTRQRLLDVLVVEKACWGGALDEVRLLQRLYDLNALPKNEHCCDMAREDIIEASSVPDVLDALSRAAVPRNWVNQDKADRGQRPASALTSDEKDKLRRLRRENWEQQQTIEILKKAAGNTPHANTAV
ncbi:hypothetical protein ABZ468_47565 [Streptomyces sp. NPDC005708]|uniref:AbiJ-related protein n=1 Tax=Streptomyces sp. NPDC005708 TaxID=3154564 RepID=UPI0034050C54